MSAPMKTPTPTNAVQALRKAGWTEAAIAKEVGSQQSSIHRIGHGREPGYLLGKALVDLAERVKQEATPA